MAEPQFTRFSDMPAELRRMIWVAALPGPRIVHLRQRKLRKSIDDWELETWRAWPPLEGDIEGDYGIHGGDWRRLDVEDESTTQGEGHETEDHISSDSNVERRATVQRELGDAMGLASWPSVDYTDDQGRVMWQPEDYRDANLVGMYSEVENPIILYVCRESRDIVLEYYTCAFYCSGSIPQTYIDFAIDMVYIRYNTYSTLYSDNTEHPLIQDLKLFKIHDLDNVKKVQRLGVYLKELDRTPGRDIADVLAFFGGVRELTIIEGHAERARRNHGYDTDLLLFQPIGLDGVMKTFDTFDARDLVHWYGVNRGSPNIHELPDSNAMQRYDQIARFHAADLAEEESSCDWVVPTVGVATMVTRGNLIHYMERLSVNMFGPNELAREFSNGATESDIEKLQQSVRVKIKELEISWTTAERFQR